MVYIPSQCHPWIRALILRDADMTDLELRSGTPYQPLYRISGSLRPDPLAGIDAWGCYTLSAHLCPLRRLIFRISLFEAVGPIYLFLSRDGGVKNATRESLLWGFFRFRDTPLRDIHFSDQLFFYLRFVTFTVLSLCPRCDLWPISHASSRTSIIPVFSCELTNYWFLRRPQRWICRNNVFCQFIYCP